MSIDRAVLVFAGCLMLLSAALVYLVSPWFLLLTAFVGLNMVQSAFTGFCPAAIVFKGLGCRVGEAFR
jgi:positive regulator of sigma E activity